jgi:hypothetical protein
MATFGTWLQSPGILHLSLKPFFHFEPPLSLLPSDTLLSSCLIFCSFSDFIYRYVAFLMVIFLEAYASNCSDYLCTFLIVSICYFIDCHIVFQHVDHLLWILNPYVFHPHEVFTYPLQVPILLLYNYNMTVKRGRNRFAMHCIGPLP